jgi:hypothetical protein
MGCHPPTPSSEPGPPKVATSARDVTRAVIVAMNGAEVIIVLNERPATLLAAVADLDECDGYVVLVFDPETGEMDAHGPYEGVAATLRAEELRRTFDHDDLADVVVRVSRLHLPTQVPQQVW